MHHFCHRSSYASPVTVHAARPTARRAGPDARRGGRGGDRLAGLDGLRGLAVLAVLVFHLHPAWLPGGFLGVDVFFVISGFLITTLLLRERRWSGRIDLPGFWTRRARRLLPALLVLVPVSTLLAALVQRDLLVGVGRQSLGALTFSSNWLEIAAGSDYFHATSPQLFMNLWSLAVEEQFYLLWPLTVLLLLAATCTTRARVAVALTLAGGSALLMAVLLDPEAPTRVYYGTDTHLVGLMLGAALAFGYAAPHRAWTSSPVWQRARRPAVAAALLVLATLLVTLDETTPLTFRGGIALASAMTAVLVLAAVSAPGRLRTLLDGPALTWVGVRSYGIYLWHWPVLLLLDQSWETSAGTVTFVLNRLLALALTLGIAQISYRYVETPVRRHGFRAVGTALFARVRRVSGRRAWFVRTAPVALILVWVLVVLTAPTNTSTARMLSANAAALSTPAQASGSGTSADHTEAPHVESAAAAAPGAAPTTAPTLTAKARQAAFTMPTGEEMDLYGDSMAVGSIPALKYWFPGIRIDAASNRRWGDGLTRVKSAGSGVRRAVVLAFGTNAGFDEPSIEAILTALGPDRMVILVNEHGPFGRVASDNAALGRVTSAHPNVGIADWDGALTGTSGQLQPDGIHPSLTGQHLYAKVIRDAFAALSERHTGVPVPREDKPIP